MKKIVISSVLALAAVTSFAADVSVSAVRDYNTGTNGVRVEASIPMGLKASVTTLDELATRVAVGKEFALTKVGPVALSASVAGVYQDSHKGAEDGFGLTFGVGASYPVTKTVAVVASVERFVGQDRVSQFNGNAASVGLNVKF